MAHLCDSWVAGGCLLKHEDRVFVDVRSAVNNATHFFIYAFSFNEELKLRDLMEELKLRFKLGQVEFAEWMHVTSESKSGRFSMDRASRGQCLSLRPAAPGPALKNGDSVSVTAFSNGPLVQWMPDVVVEGETGAKK
jgi:hypothetical protein